MNALLVYSFLHLDLNGDGVEDGIQYLNKLSAGACHGMDFGSQRLTFYCVTGGWTRPVL